jgi:hypothetical protein
MRISIAASAHFQTTRSPADMCVIVELDNGRKVDSEIGKRPERIKYK